MGCTVLECQLEMWIKSRRHFDCAAPVFFRVKMADNEEDQSSTVKMSAEIFSHFKLVFENSASYMLQAAEKPPLHLMCLDVVDNYYYL